MKKVKVRHALIQYRVTGDHGAIRTEMAFRGQVVELPEDEARRLLADQAVIPPDQPLDRPGMMMRLPEAPTDEEIVAWVSSATTDEIVRLARERPILAHRLQGAAEWVRDHAIGNIEAMDAAAAAV